MGDSQLAMNYGPAEQASHDLKTHGKNIESIIVNLKGDLRPTDWEGGSREDYDRAQRKLDESYELIKAAVVEAGDVVMTARVGVARIDGRGKTNFA